MSCKICALIPIKFNSQRVPNKNFRLMNNKPLFYYILNTLSKCKSISRIIVNIDNSKTEVVIKEYFDNIDFYYRPKELEGGDVPTNLLFIDMIKTLQLDYNYYFQTHTTNPLLTVETIENAIKVFLNCNKKNIVYDSLFSVKKWQTRLYDQKSNAVNHNPKELLPTQDLDPLYEENSCIYIFSKETLLLYQHRIGKMPYMYCMDDIESQDIDIETDFVITEIYMKELFSNKQKVIIITGVCGGIGYATAQLFQKNDWIIVGIDKYENKEIRTQLDELYIVDISNEKELLDIVNIIKEKYKRVDCIVNNAAHQICKPLHKSTSIEWDTIMNTNVKSCFLFAKYFRDLLQENKGTIVNISSVHAIHTSENISLYAASKGCLTTLTRAMALEYGKIGIRVNAILPGAVNTGMLRAGLMRDNFQKGTVEDKMKQLGKKQCIGRVGEPQEIAELILFLSDNKKSGYIVGQSIVIDGGATIKLSTE